VAAAFGVTRFANESKPPYGHAIGTVYGGQETPFCQTVSAKPQAAIR